MAVTGLGHVSSLHVPHFLKAKTPQALQKAMLDNNMRLKAFVSYDHIQFVNGYWYAWYTIDITKTIEGSSA